MDQYFFHTPFAVNGDKTTIPRSTQSGGQVSFNEGWGPDYQRDLTTDPRAKTVDRDVMNSLLNGITVAIRQYQTHGYPEWITPANNNNTAFGYSAGVVVLYNGTPYLSLKADNQATPGADANAWQVYIQREATEAEAIEGTGSTQAMTPRRVKQSAAYLDGLLAADIAARFDVSGVPVGMIAQWGATIPPDGWLECNGQSFDMTANPELAALYPGGTVPDLRGRFVRGWANGSSTDPEPLRGLLSLQSSSNQEHHHIIGRLHADSGAAGDDISFPVREQVWPWAAISSRAIFGDMYAGYGVLPGGTGAGVSGQFVSTTDSLKSDGTAGMNEPYPANIALMYIIKTDQAVVKEGEAAPTAIIISPAVATIQAGKTQQFTATVLPSSIAGNFPVSWAVSDAALGSISNAGLYTAKAGVSGTQTIIASISTGLTATAAVTQHIYLTSITIGTIPSGLIAGNSYDIAITYAPTNYSESVVASSSDSSVATLTSGGTLTVNSAGTATLTLAGANSGITKSVTITATAAVVPEVYLQIAENLADLDDVETARDNLGLGSLAVKNSLSATDVSAVPLASATLPAGTNLNAITTAGQYFQNITGSATLALNYPDVIAGVLVVYKTGVDAGGCRQVYMPYNSTVEYRRYAYGVPLVFSSWAEY